MVEFTVKGPPVGKQRPRLGKWGVYTPSETKQYEGRLAQECVRAMRSANVKMFTAPVALFVRVRYPDNRRRDGDNVLKAAMDALNGIAYADDSLVVDGRFRLIRGSADPGVDIVIKLDEHAHAKPVKSPPKAKPSNRRVVTATEGGDE